MKILHVIPSVSPVHGGPSSAIVAMERALSARGVDVTTLTTDDNGPRNRLDQADQPAVVGGAKRIYVKKRSEVYKVAPAVIPWLWRNVRAFDAVHIHALFSFTSTASAMIARRRGVPYIVRPLGTLAGYGLSNRRPMAKRLSFRAIETGIIAHAAAIHFTSQSEWDEAKALGVPIKGLVLPLGIDIPGVGLKQAVPDAKTTLLFLSRIDPKKNIEGLLRAFAFIAKQRDDVCLVVAGDGDPQYVQSLRHLADAEGITSRTEWVGHISGDRKHDVLRNADIFVLPSFSENFGIAAAEALSYGLPCVLGEGIAIAQAAAEAGAAVLTTPDPQSVAAAIASLIDDMPRRSRMSANARALAISDYSTDKMAERLVNLYEDIAPPRSA